jgi:hypothetical protein
VYAETKAPVPNANVRVTSSLPAGLPIWGQIPSPVEHFFTDSVGYFRIRFKKRIDGRNVILTAISVRTDEISVVKVRWGMDGREGHYAKQIFPEVLQKSKGIIRLDTAKMYLNYL